MSDIKVAIIGSYRDDEVKKYNFTKDKKIFFEKCRILGKCLANNGDTLIASWSNDYLYAQLGLSTDKHIKYLFEDSADYHAMRGYIANDGPKLILYMSERLYVLFKLYLSIKEKFGNKGTTISDLSSQLMSLTIDVKASKDEKIVKFEDKDIEDEINRLIQADRLTDNGEVLVEKTYLGLLLSLPDETFINDLLNGNATGIIKTKIKINRIVEATELRTRILAKHAVENSEALIVIGGGKATEFAIDKTINSGKFLLPYPEFGGESLRYLCEIAEASDLEEHDIVPPGNQYVPEKASYRSYHNKYCRSYKQVEKQASVTDTDVFFTSVNNILAYAMDDYRPKNKGSIINRARIIINGDVSIFKIITKHRIIKSFNFKFSPTFSNLFGGGKSKFAGIVNLVGAIISAILALVTKTSASFGDTSLTVPEVLFWPLVLVTVLLFALALIFFKLSSKGTKIK